MFDWHLRVLEVYLKANRPSRTSLLHGLTLIHCRQHITCGTTLQEFLMQYEKNDQRGRRCEIDTGFCLRQLKTECYFTKSPSKALVVPVLWFSTWCFCQQILKQCLIRTEKFICFGHFLLIVEGNLQQPHDLLALACISIFSRVSSSRYFSSIPNSSMRFTRNKSWKMTKRTLSYQLSRCEVRGGKGPF